MFLLVIFLLTVLFNQNSYSEKYRVFLKDKGNIEYNDIYEKASKNLSPRALQRRAKVLPKDSLVSFLDVPIPNDYIAKIKETGAQILLLLKWLNYIVIEANQEQINQISKFKFVKFIQPITEIVPRDYTFKINSISSTLNISKWLFLNNQSDKIYGESINQLKMLSIDKLHSLGIFGDSVLFGIIDTGFRWKENKIFTNAFVQAEYDFLFQDNFTGNEFVDTSIQDHHGTMVFSIVSGIKDGFLFGSAPYSTFLLAKTEDIRKESHFEEDCFAAAIEWMDSIGVDLISSSLGYYDFDSSEIDYQISDLDGKTTLVSAYANRAKKIGIVMVSSAGNKGPNDSTVQAPAEALGEIAIGAVNPTGDTVLKFSSRGPTYDGRLKPDFVAQGTYVVCSPANPTDTVMYGSGTSVASPIFSGGVALLLSAFEELTPQLLYELLKENSSRKENPDYSWGFGLVDFYQTAINYDIIISTPFTFYLQGKQRIVFKIIYRNNIEYAQIHFRKENETTYSTEFLNPNHSSNLFYFDFYPSISDSILFCYVTAKATDGKERRKPFYQNKEFKIRIGENSNKPFFVIDSILKQEDFYLEDNVHIYPNILKENNEIVLEINNLPNQRLILQLINIFGEILDEFSIENKYSKSFKQTIPIRTNSQGIFFLRVKTSGGINQVVKLMKFF